MIDNNKFENQINATFQKYLQYYTLLLLNWRYSNVHHFLRSNQFFEMNYIEVFDLLDFCSNPFTLIFQTSYKYWNCLKHEKIWSWVIRLILIWMFLLILLFSSFPQLTFQTILWFWKNMLCSFQTMIVHFSLVNISHYWIILLIFLVHTWDLFHWFLSFWSLHVKFHSPSLTVPLLISISLDYYQNGEDDESYCYCSSMKAYFWSWGQLIFLLLLSYQLWKNYETFDLEFHHDFVFYDCILN